MKLIIIEIKTGYDNVSYDGHIKKRMSKPFNMMDTSPWGQHQLQLLTTLALFEKMTGLITHRAEVWVIGTPNSLEECTFTPHSLHHQLVPYCGQILTLLSKMKRGKDAKISSIIKERSIEKNKNKNKQQSVKRDQSTSLKTKRVVPKKTVLKPKVLKPKVPKPKKTIVKKSKAKIPSIRKDSSFFIFHIPFI